jgi:hypothetical protein
MVCLRKPKQLSEDPDRPMARFIPDARRFFGERVIA